MTGDVVISIWTVHDHPRDYPEHFVARRWEVVRGERELRRTSNVYLATDVEHMNQHFTRIGLTFLSRQAEDEPQIMGVWL